MLQFWTMVTSYAVPEIHGLERCIMWGFSDRRWRPVGAARREWKGYSSFEDEETECQDDDRLDPKAYMVMMVKWENSIALRKGIGELWQGEVNASLPPGSV